VEKEDISIIEKQALEEMDELTSEQKERLVELSPGINTIAEETFNLRLSIDIIQSEMPNP